MRDTLATQEFRQLHLPRPKLFVELRDGRSDSLPLGVGELALAAQPRGGARGLHGEDLCGLGGLSGRRGLEPQRAQLVLHRAREIADRLCDATQLGLDKVEDGLVLALELELGHLLGLQLGDRLVQRLHVV